MAQNNNLKSYIMLDASGRDVPSSNVLRTQMPRIGRWRELTAYECCNPSTFLSTTPADVSLAEIVFLLICDNIDVATAVLTPATPTVTIEDVVAVLNDKIPFYGLFSVAANGTDIELRLNLSIGEALCGDVADLTITIAAA